MDIGTLLVNADWPISYQPPIPPSKLSIDVVDTLDDYSPELLRHGAQYAEEFAECREREAQLAEKDDEDKIEDRPDDLPVEILSKATITSKEINDNRTSTGSGGKGTQ